MSEVLKIEGTIKSKLPIESGMSKAGKEWRKQNFVIDTGAEYNPEVCFSLFGDEKIAMLDSYTEGRKVDVLFNVSSREFNGKYYHNLDAWKIQSTGDSKPKVQDPAEEDDDLPF
mgnify:CR=1 FL=1